MNEGSGAARRASRVRLIAARNRLFAAPNYFRKGATLAFGKTPERARRTDIHGTSPHSLRQPEQCSRRIVNRPMSGSSSRRKRPRFSDFQFSAAIANGAAWQTAGQSQHPTAAASTPSPPGRGIAASARPKSSSRAARSSSRFCCTCASAAARAASASADAR